MLHDSPDLVIHIMEILAVWRPHVGQNKVWHFLTRQCAVCQCTVLLKHKVVTRHCAYRWLSVAKADYDSMHCMFLWPVQQKQEVKVI